MAYQKKYYFQFAPLGKSEVHVVEFWQNTGATLTAEEVKAGTPPFVVELPDLAHKFQAVRGTGAIINLLSATDMKFYTGLEHVDPQEFIVSHYIDGTLNWIGYLNSDMYSEPYDVTTNYLITVTANDGIALMDRLRFVSSDGSEYKGTAALWGVLQIILAKINLPYTDVRVSLSSTFTGYSAATDKTILHETYINCANFYDEDGLAMTLRECLDTILAPFGAFICQVNGSLYITDIHTLATGGNITFKKFNTLTEAYIADVTINVNKAISDIAYMGTGQSIDRAGGVNRQVVSYSPYPVKEVIEESIVKPGEFTTIPANFSDKDGYKYRTLGTHYLWLNTVNSGFEESCKTLFDEQTVYFRWDPSVANDEYIIKLLSDTYKYLTVSGAKYEESQVTSVSGKRVRKKYLDGVALLITGQVLAKTKANPYTDVYSGDDIAAKADKVKGLQIRYDCNIGTSYYKNETDEWISIAYYDNYMNCFKSDGSVISNEWIDMGSNGGGLLIKLSNEDVIFNGYFSFRFFVDTKISFDGMTYAEDAVLKEVWIKNLQIRLVNIDGSEIEDTDSEYIGQLNGLYSSDGQNIELKAGTQSKFSDRGQLFRYDSPTYYNIPTWTRNSQTFKIEELLLNSICSNYQTNFVTLSGMNLKNSLNMLNVLSDTYLTGKKLMTRSAVINYWDNLYSCTLVEIVPDSLTIVK